jgi:hypothetical protein
LRRRSAEQHREVVNEIRGRKRVGRKKGREERSKKEIEKDDEKWIIV